MRKKRHSFVKICAKKPWLCRTTSLSLRKKKGNKKKKKRRIEPLLKGSGKRRTHKDETAACLYFGLYFRDPLRNMGGKQKKKVRERNNGKCLCDRSMYRVYFLAPFLLCFSLIRTQAFSVFSEVCGEQYAESENGEQRRKKKRDGLWMCVHSFL